MRLSRDVSKICATLGLFVLLSAISLNQNAQLLHQFVREAVDRSTLVATTDGVADVDYNFAKEPFSLPQHRPFPRWDIDRGISFQHLMDFVWNSSRYATAPQLKQPNPLYVPTSDHQTDVNYWFPEMLYTIESTGVYESSRHAKLVGLGPSSLDDKVWPFRAIANRARDHLVQNHSQWPRLYEVVRDSGFPILAWSGDYTGCNYHNWNNSTISIPLFTMAANVHCNHTFPFPTYQTIANSKSEWDSTMEQYQHDYPWDRKVPQVVWRGGLTGKMNETHRNLRWNMLQYVQQLDSKLFNVGATRLPRRHEGLNLDLAQVGGLVDALVPMTDFMKYRGILDMDGNSWSSRFGVLLCYNSVVLKVQPSWVDYFHFQVDATGQHELQPWKHYIPIRADLSDLEEKARFVTNSKNDKRLRSMVSEANAWCRVHMQKQRLVTDVLDIWDAYVRMLDVGTSGWQEEWISSRERIFANESGLEMVLV